VTNDYIEGEHLRRLLEYVEMNRGGILRIGAQEGDFESEVRQWRLIVHHAKRPKKIRVSSGDASGRYDPEHKLLIIEVANQREAIQVEWS
jgi:hypothetical protein